MPERELSDLRQPNLDGLDLALQLEMLQERQHPKPTAQSTATPPVEPTRIVCSARLL